MRIPTIWLALALSCTLALTQRATAQSSAMQAAQASQQAMQATQAANQQAMQAAQLANQQAMQAAQAANAQAMRDAQNASQNAAQNAAHNGAGNPPLVDPVPGNIQRPKFSVSSGTYATPLTVKIKVPRDTVVYYTTDGWTPTRNSTLYTGPIMVDTTTTLQAIAVYEGLLRSIPIQATYTIQHPAAPAAQVAVSAGNEVAGSGKRMLPQGTPVQLAFAADVSSKTADIGDRIPLTLVDDLQVGGVVLVKKGTPAVAIVTGADGKHLLGVPGQIVFRADSLNVDGTLVKLTGGATKEASYRVGAAVSAFFVPVAGPFLVHGHDAEIKSGATFTAKISENTELPPDKLAAK